MLPDVTEQSAVTTGKPRQLGKTGAGGERQMPDHAPEKRFGLAEGPPLRRGGDVPDDPLQRPGIDRELPTMPLLPEEIHARQDRKVEVAAQKPQSRPELKPEIQPLRQEHAESGTQHEPFAAGVVPHLPLPRQHQKEPVEKMGVPPLPGEVGESELVQLQPDHIVNGAPLRIFGQRHKIISFRPVFTFPFRPFPGIIIAVTKNFNPERILLP